MSKILGSVFAGLVIMQGGLPSLGLTPPLSNIVALGVAIAVGAVGYYLKGTGSTPPAAP